MSNPWRRDDYLEYCLGIWGSPLEPSYGQIGLMTKMALLIEGDSVLDAGCGFGHLRQVILNLFGGKVTYIGLDSSPEMLKFSQGFFPNDNWVVGDIGTYSIKVDSTVCCDVLIHNHDTDNLIKNMWDNTNISLIFSMNCSEDNEYLRATDGPIEFHYESLVMKRVSAKNILSIINKLEGVGSVEEIPFDNNITIFKLGRT